MNDLQTKTEEKELGETLSQLFNSCRERFVFDPIRKCIDFTTRRSTDYKLNKNVILPRPMDASKELQCELRRKGYLKAFDKYENDFKLIDTKRIER